jgi:hypothetical protein
MWFYQCTRWIEVVTCLLPSQFFKVTSRKVEEKSEDGTGGGHNCIITLEAGAEK